MSSDVERGEATLLGEERKGEDGIKRIRGGAKERRNSIYYLTHMLGKLEVALSEHAAC